jgi:hypothetical protein
LGGERAGSARLLFPGGSRFNRRLPRGFDRAAAIVYNRRIERSKRSIIFKEALKEASGVGL